MNGDPTEIQRDPGDLMFQILKNSGLQGTPDQFKENILTNPDLLEKAWKILQNQGFKGTQRDVLNSFGVSAPNYGGNPAFVSETPEAVVESQTKSELEQVEDASASRNQQFIGSLFQDESGFSTTPAVEGVDPKLVDPELALFAPHLYETHYDNPSLLSEINKDKDKYLGYSEGARDVDQFKFEYRVEDAIDNLNLTSSALDPNTSLGDTEDAKLLDYAKYNSLKRWTLNRGLAMGSPMSQRDAKSLSEEIYQDFKENDLYKRDYLHRSEEEHIEEIEKMLYETGLLTDSSEVSSRKEERQGRIIGDRFDFGKYTRDQINEVPTIDTGEGITPFYTSSLDKINPAFIPDTEEELASAQESMPEKLSSFDSASEYYKSIGDELTKEEYKKVAGYWAARNEVLSVEDTKRKAKDEVSSFVDEYNNGVTDEERKATLDKLRAREPELLRSYNKANEVLGNKRRAYTLSEMTSQMAMDDLEESTNNFLIDYRNSAEFYGRKVAEESLMPNTFQQGMGMITGAWNQVETWQEAAREEPGSVGGAIGLGVLGVSALWSPDIPEFREYSKSLGMDFKWTELSAGINRAQALNKGLTEEQIARGITGQKAGDVAEMADMAWIQLADAAPQMAMQFVGMFTGATEATLATMALGSGGAMAEDLRDNPNLSLSEKSLFSTLAFGAEYASEKIFRRADNLSVNRMRKFFGLSTKEATRAVGDQTKRSAFKRTIDGWNKVMDSTPWMLVEEGVEEGLVSMADQGLRIATNSISTTREIESLKAKLDTPGIAPEVAGSIRSSLAIKKAQREEESFSFYEVADSFIVGALAGNTQLAITRSFSYLASTNLRSQIKLRNKYQKFQEELRETKDPKRRQEIKQELISLEEEQIRLTNRDLSFLSNLSDEDAEKLMAVNRSIYTDRLLAKKTRKLLQEAKDEGDEAAVKIYEAQIESLAVKVKSSFEEKFAIEGAYSQVGSYVEDSMEDEETMGLLEEIGSTDPEIRNYGRVGRGNTVELEEDNAESLIERIISKGRIKSTKHSTARDIIEGLRNIPKIIATIKANGGTGKVFLHGTESAWIKATKEKGKEPKLSRGLFVGKNGDVHLFMPALKANTAYHEAYHAATLRNENQDQTKEGTRRLAYHLARLMPDPVQMLNFIKNYLPENRKNQVDVASTDQELARQLLMQVVNENPDAADEILTEILADITKGDLSIEYRKGLIRGLLDFIKVKFGGKIKDPTIKDVVSAIQEATKKMEAGEAVEDTTAITQPASEIKAPKPATEGGEDKEKEEEDPKTKAQDIVEEVKSKTVSGKRIGQGRATRKVAGETVVGKGSDDGTLDVSIAALREKSPDIYLNNSLYLSELDLVRAVKTFNPSDFKGDNAMATADEVYQIFTDEVVDNLLFLHDTFNESDRGTATLWYDGANIISQELSDEYGLSVESVAATIAALSPQKDWYQNLRLAEIVIEFMSDIAPTLTITQDLVDHHSKKKWGKDLQKYVGQTFASIGSDVDKAAILWAYADLNLSKEYRIISPDGTRLDFATKADGGRKKAAWGSRSMIAAALNATQTSDQSVLSEILGQQHKIRNFYNNIVNPRAGSDATIDTHAVAAGHVKPLAGADAEVSINLGGSKAFIDSDGRMMTLGQVKDLATKSLGRKKSVSAKQANAWAAKNGFRIINVKSSGALGFKGMYYAYLDAYRKAAEARGLLPREMQSITWEAVRLLYTSTFKANSQNKKDIELLHKEYTDGEITKEQLRERLLERADGIGRPDWSDARLTETDSTKSQKLGGVSEDSGREDRGEATGRGRGDAVLRKQIRAAQREGDGLASQDIKRQDIVDTIGDLMTVPSYTLKLKGRGKNKTLVLEETNQLNLYIPKKDEILKILQESGMSKKDAEKTYQDAKLFVRGKKSGRKEQAKIADKRRKERDKLSDEAKKLREELDNLKNKTKTAAEFFREAKKLIVDRMGRGKGASNKFTAKQIQSFFSIASRMARASAVKLKGNEMDYIDSLLDKMSEIFDQQDSKAVMEQYLKDVASANDLQKKIKKKSKGRDFSTFRTLARSVAEIKSSLIPLEDMQAYLNFLGDVNDSMTKARLKKDKDGSVVFTPSQLKDIKLLKGSYNVFKAIEQEELNAKLRKRALNAVEKAKKEGRTTTFAREYNELLQRFSNARLTPIKKEIEERASMMQDENGNPLDPSNVQDLEQILSAIARDRKELNILKKQTVIDEGIISKLLQNADEILEDPSFALIFGISDASSINAETAKRISERLNRLEIHHLLALEYKMNDFLVNGRVNGIGYIAAIARGKIDLPDLIEILTINNVRSRKRVLFGGLADQLSSYMRNAFAVNNITISRIKNAIGVQDLIMSINQHEQEHLETAQAISDKIIEINKSYGLKGETSISSNYVQAITQIYSMYRQVPEGMNQADWAISLKEAMENTIADMNKNNSFDKEIREEYQRAFDFLFSGQNINEIVESSMPEVVEMADFMVQLHESKRTALEDFTERFLGKELEIIPSYTSFSVKKKTGVDEVDGVMEIRKKLLSNMSQTGGSNYNKIPGATHKRESRAVDGKTLLGLNFLEINHSTLKENSFIENTLGSVLAYKYAFASSQMDDLMSSKIKGQMDKKIDNYLLSDVQSNPFVFQKHVTVFDRKVFNPLEMFRAAAVVNAFGGFLIQFFKQGGVAVSTAINMRSVESLMYFATDLCTNLALTFYGKDKDGKNRILSDPTPKIQEDKYQLLKNSAIFLRDYKAGSIDPFSGRVDFNKTRFYAVRDALTDKSMWTLSTTDKVVAVSSFFAYYADFLKSQGLVESISDIDWKQEAANPNKDALAHADNMVEKDQNTSSARMAAAVYQNGDGYGRIMMQLIMPFQSFAINTKRSITADLGRLGNKDSRADGIRGLIATSANLYLFHMASKIIVSVFQALIRSLFFDDDEEIDLLPENLFRDSAVSTFVDSIPLPSISMVDDNVKDFFNTLLMYSEDDFDMPGLSLKERLQMYKKYGGAVPTFAGYSNTIKTENESFAISFIESALGVLGPAGDFTMKGINTAIVGYDLLKGDNSYVTSSGRRRFIRPEDQDLFAMSTALKAIQVPLNVFGIGSKELDYFAKAMDDRPLDRALSSEEELAAFELVKRMVEKDPQVQALINSSEEIGIDRLMMILQDQRDEDTATYLKGLSVSKFDRAIDPAMAESYLKRVMPSEYSKHMSEVRRLSGESAKKIALVLKLKKSKMTPDEYNRYSKFVKSYLFIKSESSLLSLKTEQIFSE